LLLFFGMQSGDPTNDYLQIWFGLPALSVSL